MSARWAALGWFVGAKKWSGSTYIASVIAEDRGLWKGLLRGTPPLLGSKVNATWSGKDVAALGTLTLAALDDHNQYNSLFLMAATECAHNWCNERDPALYAIFKIFLSRSPSVDLLLDLLQEVLCRYWNARVERSATSMRRTAQQLGLKHLPLCFGLIDGTGVSVGT